MNSKESYILLLNLLKNLKNSLYSEKIEYPVFLKENVNLNVLSFQKGHNIFISDLKKTIKNCVKCKISETRQNVVFGSGDTKSPLFIIGEAPGEKEDQQGLPFVGKSGNLLIKLLENIGLTREKVFISNIIKCRPPSNRNPNSEEINNCSPYLESQIDLINPKIILTLGNFSTQFILEKKNIGISKLRGTILKYPKNLNIMVLATYHPSALLRNPNLIKEFERDLQELKEFLKIHSPKIFSKKL